MNKNITTALTNELVGDFTLMGWFQFEVIPDEDNLPTDGKLFEYSVKEEVALTVNLTWTALPPDTSTCKLVVLCKARPKLHTTYIHKAIELDPGESRHIAIVKDGKNLLVYLDSVLITAKKYIEWSFREGGELTVFSNEYAKVSDSNIFGRALTRYLIGKFKIVSRPPLIEYTERELEIVKDAFLTSKDSQFEKLKLIRNQAAALGATLDKGELWGCISVGKD